jgi:hypothetical protein
VDTCETPETEEVGAEEDETLDGMTELVIEEEPIAETETALELEGMEFETNVMPLKVGLAPEAEEEPLIEVENVDPA